MEWMLKQMERMTPKLVGLMPKSIFYRKSGLEAVKLECELLSHIRVQATREIHKALVQGKIPSKIIRSWVEEAKAIECQGNDVLKSDQRSVISPNEGEQLMTMHNKVVDHLKKSPIEKDLIDDKLVYITVIKRSSVSVAIVKGNFMQKTKTLKMAIKQSETKATSGVEVGMSPVQERQAEESMKAGKDTNIIASTSFQGELKSIIKDEMKSKSVIEEIEELPSQENEETTMEVGESTKMTPGLSVPDKIELEQILVPGSESAASMAIPKDKLTSTEETTETQVIPVQRNEAKTTDISGSKEVTPGLSIQSEAVHSTEFEIMHDLVTESSSASGGIPVPTIEIEEECSMPLSSAKILSVEEEFKTESIAAEPEGMSPFPGAEILRTSKTEVLQPILVTDIAITVSETGIECQRESDSSVDHIRSVAASTEDRLAQYMNPQLVIFPVGHSTKMHNVIKDPEFVVLVEESDYLACIRADEKIENPPNPESYQGKISDGASLSSRILERPERTNISLPEDFILSMLHEGKRKPPIGEKWKRPSVIVLMGNEFSSLPHKPNCPNLRCLFIQNNRRLRTIPESFFDNMPYVKVLDLSKTGVRSLPTSLFKLTRLQALFLRDCDSLDELPPEIGNLQCIEILDLWGTELYNLPDEIGNLSHLKHLRVSFYGVDDHDEYPNLPPDLVSQHIISKLLALHALSIVVHPEDQRWNESAEEITRDVGSLSGLTYLQFYFPEVKFLELFMQRSPSWKEGRLSKFKFVVGQDFKRIVSRVPDDVVSEYDKHDRCLRYVNGDEIPKEVARLLVHVTAFYLDHHCVIKNLSEFGLANFKELKFCVVRECPNIVEIVDNDEGRDSVLPCLLHLSMHYLCSLERVWKGTVPHGSLDGLKVLSVHTCPKLEFLLTQSMLHCLSNLQELIVEDCESLEVMIKMEDKKANDCVILPSLKKIRLCYLPKLVSLGNGVHPLSAQIDSHCCPKFEENSTTCT